MTSPAAGKHAMTFVFLTVLVDTIGFGIVLPVMPRLLMELTGETVSEASLDGGWLAFSYAIAQFIFGPVIGNLSDRFGRRPVLITSLVAFGLDYAVMGLAPSLGWLFLGRVIAGIAGAAYTTANACVADISPPEKRAQNFGLMGAAFGVGFILGPALGGLLGSFGPRAPFFAAGILAALNALYGYFVFPETLPAEARRPFTWRRANTLGTVLQLRRYPAVWDMVGALFLWQLGHQVLPNTWAYYTKLKLEWSEEAIGMSLAFAGVTMAVVQGGLTRAIIPKMGERSAALIGLSVGALGYLGYALSSETWMIYACIVFGSLAGLAQPSINGLMSRHLPASAQGELQGGVSSLWGLTSIVGPLLMTGLFEYFTNPDGPIYFPGAAFVFAAILAAASAAMFLRAMQLAARERVEPQAAAE